MRAFHVTIKGNTQWNINTWNYSSIEHDGFALITIWLWNPQPPPYLNSLVSGRARLLSITLNFIKFCKIASLNKIFSVRYILNVILKYYHLYSFTSKHNNINTPNVSNLEQKAKTHKFLKTCGWLWECEPQWWYFKKLSQFQFVTPLNKTAQHQAHIADKECLILSHWILL